LAFSGGFLQISIGMGALETVSLTGPSIRLNESHRTAFAENGDRNLFVRKVFWRIRSIDYLHNYPEKTDRMVQRLAAGKNP